MPNRKPDFERIYESVMDIEPRSKLEPYCEVILRWRRKRPPVSYRRILQALAAEGVTVTVRTLYEFVKRRSRPRTEISSVPSEFPPPNQAEFTAELTREVNQMHLRSHADMVAQRESIRAMYTKVTFVDETPKKEFVFDPDQPLINKNY